MTAAPQHERLSPVLPNSAAAIGNASDFRCNPILAFQKSS
jgi:hypothetical protein